MPLMSNDLRTKLIRLASTMSRGSSERTALLKVLASGPAPDGSNWRIYRSKGVVSYGWTKREGIKFIVMRNEAYGDYELFMTINNSRYYSRRAFTPNKEDHFADAKILFDWYVRHKEQNLGVVDDELSVDYYRNLVNEMPLSMKYETIKVNQPIRSSAR